MFFWKTETRCVGMWLTSSIYEKLYFCKQNMYQIYYLISIPGFKLFLLTINWQWNYWKWNDKQVKSCFICPFKRLHIFVVNPDCCSIGYTGWCHKVHIKDISIQQKMSFRLKMNLDVCQMWYCSTGA